MTWPWVTAFVALWVFTLFLATLFLGQIRRMSNLLQQTEFRLELASNASGGLGGLAPGAMVPPFRVEGSDGAVVASERILARPAVVLFMEEGCEPCEGLLSDLMRTETPPGLHLILFVDGDVVPPASVSASVFRQIKRSASRAFAQVAFPQAFAVDASRIVIDRLIPESLDDLFALGRLVDEVEGGDSLRTGVEPFSRIQPDASSQMRKE